MVSAKLLFVVIFYFQPRHTLSQYIIAETDTTEAHKALDSLYEQIQSSTILASITGSRLWSNYVGESSQIVNQLVDEIQKFSIIVENLTEIGATVEGGNDCVSPLGIFLDAATYQVDVVSNMGKIYNSASELATANIHQIMEKYLELDHEFMSNCELHVTNCEATVKYVIAEVERVLPSLHRIPYQLLIEIHYIGYKFAVNWELIRTRLMVEYNWAVYNSTSCLTFKIGQSTPPSVDDTLANVNDTFDILYQNLFKDSQAALTKSLEKLIDNYLDIIKKMVEEDQDISDTFTKWRVRVNKTADALVQVTKDFNVTTTCTLSDDSEIKARFSRKSNEPRDEATTVTYQYEAAYRYFDNSIREVNTINQQIGECFQNRELPNCQILAKRIIAKTKEIPWQIEKLERLTSALFYQGITELRANGGIEISYFMDLVTDALISFKSCLQYSL